MSVATKSLSATGRRKNATARVRMTEGSGTITINGRPFDDYFATLKLQNAVLAPFQQANLLNRFDLDVTAKGGGLHGQANFARCSSPKVSFAAIRA